MCGCERHLDKTAPCDCICDEHANFEAARDLAMRRYDAIVALQREHDELADERDEWRERAQSAEQRLRDIEGIAEGHVGEIAAGQLPPPLFD